MQQEKAIRSYEIYFDIISTDTDILKAKYSAAHKKIEQASGPLCNWCIIDGFKKMTLEIKKKVNLLHYFVADHVTLIQCKRCSLVTQDYILPVHQHFDCDDRKAKQVFASNPTKKIFRRFFP